MNIFALHPSPIISAHWLCNHHIVKMLSESAEMMLLAQAEQGMKIPVTGIRYRLSHKNHPCTIWASANGSNYYWLWRHAVAMCNEYWKRYGQWKGCTHDYQWEILGWLSKWNDADLKSYRMGEPTNFALCISNFVPTPWSHDEHEVYRQYYISKKYTSKRMLVWPDREPGWYTHENAKIVEFDIREASDQLTGNRDVVPFFPDLPEQRVPVTTPVLDPLE